MQKSKYKNARKKHARKIQKIKRIKYESKVVKLKAKFRIQKMEEKEQKKKNSVFHCSHESTELSHSAPRSFSAADTLQKVTFHELLLLQ